MCFLFHDWEKWGEPYRWEGYIYIVGNPESQQRASELRQDRVCHSCGKRQTRIIAEG